MAMELGKLIESLPARLMALWVRPDVLPKSPSELLDPSLPVLYVLEIGGLADRTALNLVCRDLGLPHPGDPLHYGDSRERSSVDVLQRRRGWLGRSGSIVSRRLERLVAAAGRPGAGGLAAGDLQIVPVAIYWGRAPDRETSVLGLATSENWDVGGRTAKLVTTLVHGRNTLVRFSEPISLSRLLETSETAATAASGPGVPAPSGGASDEAPDADGADADGPRVPASADPARAAALLTRKLSRILRVHFRQRRIATVGPDRSHRRTIVAQVLADDAVRRAVALEAKSSGRAVERVRRRAEGYALEIAADVSYPTIRLLDRLLTKLWTELYDGIELSGLDRLRAVADGREIVYVPCHRSHIDYLLLSWLMVREGYSLPHVAAGINLNLPIVGGIMRRGGAFFLRRTFSGNAVYAAVFSSYLKEILQRGHALEYFIEGGRSRTGRLLPAKGGMLAMTVHAYLRRPRVPVVFVPVYFGYERLIEGRSFTRELAGGKKRKESVFGFVRSLRRLRDDYGRVHVGIGDPLLLDGVLDAHRPDWRDEPIGIERPDWIKPVVDELGSSILSRINGAASVTPVALLATAMLATSHGRLGRVELCRQIRLYASLLRATHADTHVVVPDIDPEAVVRHGVELGYLETASDDIGELVALRAGQAPALTYFRNNIMHLLVQPSLVAAAFTGVATRSDAGLRRLVQTALPFLHAELFVPPEPDERAFERALAALVDHGLLARHGEGWRRAAAGSPEAVSLLRLAEVVLPSVERYYLCAALLVQAGAPLARDELGRRCAACASRLATTEGRDAQDLHDRHLFRGLVERLRAHGYVDGPTEALVAAERLTTLENEARRLLDDGIRHAILRAALACTAARGEGADDGNEGGGDTGDAATGATTGGASVERGAAVRGDGVPERAPGALPTRTGTDG